MAGAWLKIPATTAPQRLKTPPISTVATRVMEVLGNWKPIARGTPICAASRQPATPVMNEASANAHIL